MRISRAILRFLTIQARAAVEVGRTEGTARRALREEGATGHAGVPLGLEEGEVAGR
jgi:hypothetical protein